MEEKTSATGSSSTEVEILDMTDDIYPLPSTGEVEESMRQKKRQEQEWKRKNLPFQINLRFTDAETATISEALFIARALHHDNFTYRQLETVPGFVKAIFMLYARSLVEANSHRPRSNAP